MGWLTFGLAVAIVLIVTFYAIWRRWIEPWREVEELVHDIAAGRPPRKFLMSANRRARGIGLALEPLASRQLELERNVHEGVLSVQAILGALPDGLVVVDDRRRAQMMNAEFRRVFGIGDNVTGVPLLEMIRDVAVDRLLAEALDTGEPRRESIQISRVADKRLEIEVSAVPFRANSSQTSGAIVLFRDITQLRRLEEMRRDFVANVSHELRTPLSIFRGYLETLLEHPKQSPAELLRIFEVMEKHSNRLNLLVEDVLSLAQLEEPGTRLNYTEIYLPDFLGAIVRDWEKRFEAKLLDASVDSPADLPVLSADENRLQEVIYNLLDNAVKYSQPEGKIVVKAVREADQVRIAISDQGIGIPSRDLPRIFERFYRADKARSRELGGTGLGLSIVKHIVELHGGSVEAESTVGRGTTISVRLPIGPPDEAAVTET
jgi:two-component system phosphate regulon sensor histidine kinase PhoR